MRVAGRAATSLRLPRLGWHLPACRCCGAPVTETLLDLGLSAAGDAAVPIDAAMAPLSLYPLRALACADCGLVQLAEHGPTIAEARAARPTAACGGRQLAGILADRLGLGAGAEAVVLGTGEEALVVGLAASGAVVLSMDDRPGRRHRGRGATAGFGSALARRLRAIGHAPGLICARQVLAEAAEPHDLAAGCRILLAPGGTLVLELPDLLRLVCERRFDAIRPGRRSYFSLATLEALLAEHGLAVFDVEPAQGEEAMLRAWIRHGEETDRPVSAAVAIRREAESEAGLHLFVRRHRFADEVVAAKCAILDFLIGMRGAGRRVAGFGAPAGADRLLSYCGVGPELLPFVVDPLPGRQGLLLPASRIPVLPTAALAEDRPDFLLLLGWTAPHPRSEEVEALQGWGGRLVAPLPRVALM